jgi:predicted TIM-barrel fold metal-dependent hydrolase
MMKGGTAGKAPDFVRRALSGPARRRIMFGSDYPVFANLYTERDWIELVLQEAQNEGQPFPEEDLLLFFSENALRFLGLEPVIKGG